MRKVTAQGVRQRGFTLLEIIIGLAIFSAGLIGISQVMDRFSEDTMVSVAASQSLVVGDAARAYIKDNYSAVLAVATATTPAYIDVPTLVSAGYLTSGYVATNSFRQHQCVLVLEPSAGKLQAVVVAEGGTSLDDLTLGLLAARIGGSGGGIYSTEPTSFKGALGGWTLPLALFDNQVNSAGKNCEGSAGNVVLTPGRPVMALWFDTGDTSTAFLARDLVPGRPELNEMNTPLVMNSVQVVNDACSRLGAIARSSTGAVLSCISGAWKTQGSSYWEDPVANFASLPPCTAAIDGQTRVAKVPSVGTGPRAYTCSGTVWTALAVDNSGNLTVTGTASVGKVQLLDTVAIMSGCSTTGNVAKDATGQVLSCQSGFWRPSSASGGSFGYAYQTFAGGYWYTVANPRTGGLSCPPGYSAHGGLTGQAFMYSQWDATMIWYHCVSS